MNCDSSELVGVSIQKNLDRVSFDQCSIKRNDQVNTLASIKVGVIVEEKPITVDPSVFFNCLSMLIKKDERRMKMFNIMTEIYRNIRNWKKGTKN